MATNKAIIYHLPPQTPVTLEDRNTMRRSGGSSSTTTTAHAPARDNRSYVEERLKKVFDYYCESFERARCPKTVQDEIISAIMQGMHASVIIAIMDATQEAPRPAWAYARSIMQRCLNERCMNMEQWEARQARHRIKNHYGMNGAEKAKLDAACFDDLQI